LHRVPAIATVTPRKENAMTRLVLLGFVAIGAVAAGLARAAEIQSQDKKPLRILFVGNSYTQVNSLDRLVKALLESQGQKVEIGGYLAGGRSLMAHWNENLGTVPQGSAKDEKAAAAAKASAARKGQFDQLLNEQGPWDYVVLQGQSRDTLDGEKWEFRKYAGLFVEKIRKANPQTKVLFYLTWARQHLPEEQATITKTYLEVARQHDALAAPVGEAWKDAFAARPGLVLHMADQSHPNAMGSYLAGCVFYATITGRSPVGLPGKVAAIQGKDGKPVYDLSDADAKFLQETAWKTVQRVKP
jgi:hypothetical protein